MKIFNNVLMVVSSPGGHTTEVEYALKNFKGEKILLTKNLNIRNCNDYSRILNIANPHNNLLILYLINSFQSLFILLKYRPKVIFTTGSGIAIPICIMGKIFRSKIIFLESCCRIKEISRTGKLMYYLADKFIVQWPELKDKYKKAIYVGGLF